MNTLTVNVQAQGTNHLARRGKFKILSHRPRWGLTWLGWLMVLVVLSAGTTIAVRRAYFFLAVTEPVPASVLVVEGWVPNYAIQLAAREYSSGKYERVFSTGGPVRGMGGYTNDYNTTASVAAGNLKAAGIPTDRLQMTPSRIMNRDRTYSAAVALRDWLLEHKVEVTAMNVVTEGAHARRTRLLYREAFGKKVKVGIIAAQSPDYDPAHWWRYSEGVKDVESEALGYFYARFFFSPGR